MAGAPASLGEEKAFALGAHTIIGGAGSCDIVLDGVADELAIVEWVPDGDEFVFRPLRTDGTAMVDGQVQTTGLHHGDRVELDHWVLVFQRDESADHVRSDDKARQGGEYAGGGITEAGGHPSEPD
jgi:hypothetical protein